MLRLLENEPLAKYTSWRIGGPARYLAEATTPDDLREALAWARERDLAVTLLGGGTNTLVLDDGVDGVVLRYRNQQVQIEPQQDTTLAILASGAPTAGTARRLTHSGWSGLEWAEGLPGTIGGAVFGNAGCYGSDMATILTRAWLLVDHQIEEWPVERFGYGYRSSALKGQERHELAIILAAEVRLQRGDPQQLADRMEQTAAARRSKTPAGQSCGSVFKNPIGDSAGRLIEAAGLKGLRVGAAEIAQKHGNYIVNMGGASSSDVLRLIDIIRERVLLAFGIELALEIRIVGSGYSQ
jgi:UDP-N-acetylmuramate dehydrogenase